MALRRPTSLLPLGYGYRRNLSNLYPSAPALAFAARKNASLPVGPAPDPAAGPGFGEIMGSPAGRLGLLGFGLGMLSNIGRESYNPENVGFGAGVQRATQTALPFAYLGRDLTPAPSEARDPKIVGSAATGWYERNPDGSYRPVVGAAPSKTEARERPMTDAEKAEYGIPEADRGMPWTIKDGSPRLPGGYKPETTFNIGGDMSPEEAARAAGLEKEAEARADFAINSYNTTVTAANTAATRMARNNAVRQANEAVRSGLFGNELLAIQKGLERVGVSADLVGDTASAELMQSMGTEYALEYTSQTKGAISDREWGAFNRAAVGLARSPEGNEMLLGYYDKLDQRLLDKQRFFDDYQARNDGSLVGVNGEWNKYVRDNPLFTDDEMAALTRASESGAPARPAETRGQGGTFNDKPAEGAAATGYVDGQVLINNDTGLAEMIVKDGKWVPYTPQGVRVPIPPRGSQ